MNCIISESSSRVIEATDASKEMYCVRQIKHAFGALHHL